MDLALDDLQLRMWVADLGGREDCQWLWPRGWWLDVGGYVVSVWLLIQVVVMGV